MRPSARLVSSILRLLQLLTCGLAACLALTAETLFAQTTTYTVPLIPKYQVMAVVYAPPGSASSVTYSDSVSVGSANSFITNKNDTYTQTSSTTSGFTLSLGAFSFGSSTTNTQTSGWGVINQNSTENSIQTTQGNSVSTAGPISSALGVNHDNDIIYVWLNPMIITTTTATSGIIPLSWTGLQFNSCDVTDTGDPLNFYQVMNGCDQNQYPFPDIVGIPVWCLKNPYYPAPACAQWLAYTSRSWDGNNWGTSSSNGLPLGPGLTLQDYADILSADPFVTQTLVASNTTPNYYCHPTYGVNVDPNDQEIILVQPATVPPSGMAWPANYCGLPNNSSTTQVTMQRFDPVDTVQYPAPGINGEPQTYSGTFAYNKTVGNSTSATYTSTHGNATSTTNSFGYNNALPIPVPGIGNIILGLGFSISNTSGSSQSWTNSQTNANTTTTVNNNSASYSITGPQASDNYTGPVVFDVYKDNVFGTFAFYSNLQRQQQPVQLVSSLATAGSAPIGVALTGGTTPCTATACFSSASVGKLSTTTLTATLTNNSPYPMTMVGPAVTFSDPGFIVVPGSDNCSNQVLNSYLSSLGGYTCTMTLQYMPVVSDARNAVVASYPVTANLIAAGTENVPFYYESTPYYENILVTSTGQTVGSTATPITSAAGCTSTLVPTVYPVCDIGATAYPTTQNVTGQPNGYQFATVTAFGTAETQAFTFTNNYSSSVTFPSHTSTPPDFTLTDGTNFTIVNDTGTGGCAGATVAAFGGTCTFSVQYKPMVQGSTPGAYGTGITAMGTVNWPTGATSVQQLATAGAIGALTSTGMGVTSSFSIPTCYITQNTTSGSCGGSTTVTLTNTGTFPIVLTTPTGTNGFSGSASGTLAAGKSMTASASASETCNNGPFGNCSYSGTVTYKGTAQTGGSGTPVSATSSGNFQIIFCPSPCIPPHLAQLTINGAELSNTVTTPATLATGTITIKGVVQAPFTGLKHIEVNVGSFTAEAYYGKAATDDTVAKALAAKINVAGSPIKATISGNVLKLTSRTAGTAANLAFTTTGTRDFGFAPKTGSLTGGTDAKTTTVYDGGSVNATVGTTATSVAWDKASTAKTVAAALASSLNTAGKGTFAVTASGNTITITPSDPNSTPAVTISVKDSKGFNPASFAGSAQN